MLGVTGTPRSSVFSETGSRALRNMSILGSNLGANVTELADDNKALRVQLATLTAQLSSAEEAEAQNQKASRALAIKLEHVERSYSESEGKLQSLRPLAERLSMENSRLSRDNQELFAEVEKLQDKLNSIGGLRAAHRVRANGSRKRNNVHFRFIANEKQHKGKPFLFHEERIKNRSLCCCA